MKKIFQLSIIKTIYFNLMYFGVGGAVRPRVYVARNVKLRKCNGTVSVEHGDHAFIGFQCSGIVDLKTERAIWENNGDVVFKDNVVLGSGTKISCAKNAKMFLGENSTIIANSSLVARKQIQIGREALISWDCLIMDSDFHSIYREDGMKINEDRSITVGENVWIGCRTTILKGAIIPNKCIIGACSLITRRLDVENAVYTGYGCLRKENIIWNH